MVDGFRVLGGMQDLNRYQSDVAVVLAVANPQIRRTIRSRIENPRVSFPVLIHPSSMPGDTDRNHLGEGTIITAGNILTTNIRVGSFVIINLACTIGHDVAIGDFCSIMPGCSISGFVSIGEAVQLGSGAIILPGLGIGSNSRVGAGAVVTRNVMADTTVVGVPAKVM